jgi:hypothetical protein
LETPDATTSEKAGDENAGDEKAGDEKAGDEKAGDENAGDEGSNAEDLDRAEAALAKGESMMSPSVDFEAMAADPTLQAAARKPKPMTWRQIAPFLFSGLGVLLAYEIGKVRAVPRD